MTIDQKAQALLRAHRVYELLWDQEYSIYEVEDDSGYFHVQFWAKETFSCTCPYWMFREAACVHILAAQTYQKHTIRLSHQNLRGREECH